MSNPKKEAMLCHKLAVLSNLMIQTLDDLNWDTVFSNGFQSDLHSVMERSETLMTAVFEAPEVRRSVYLTTLSTKVDTVIRKNYDESPPMEEYYLEKDKMKYSIFDNDTGDYMATGLNSKTKEDCLEAWIMYKTGAIDSPKSYLKLLELKNWVQIETELQSDNFMVHSHLDILLEREFL